MNIRIWFIKFVAFILTTAMLIKICFKKSSYNCGNLILNTKVKPNFLLGLIAWRSIQLFLFLENLPNKYRLLLSIFRCINFIIQNTIQKKNNSSNVCITLYISSTI